MSREAILSNLQRLSDLIRSDPGLRSADARATAEEIELGIQAADRLSVLLADAIDTLGLNDDGWITGDDLRAISDWIRADPDRYALFVEVHGDDGAGIETGYHYIQNDGGTYTFQNRQFINGVVDAIFHIGFAYADGYFFNEDGDRNKQVDDIAGWLNYFVNGVNAVYGTDGDDRLITGAYSDDLLDAANEYFDGGDGNDTISGNIGNDTILGGRGNDLVVAGDGMDSVDGGTGNDTIYADDGDDVIKGGMGNDVLLGGMGNDTIFGGMDDDLIDGGKDHDLIYAGAGNDTVIGGIGNDKILGQEGNDVIRADGGWDTVLGGNGDDTIMGGGGDDQLCGEDGNDVIFGEQGDDWISGGAGNDVLGGGFGDDVIRGEDGDDNIMGGMGDDTLKGGDGADTIYGGAGADRIFLDEATASQDILVFNPGDSTAANTDVIFGFVSGEDKIDLTGFGYFNYVGQMKLTGNGIASARFNANVFQIDTDGDGTADFSMEVRGTPLILSQDLMIDVDSVTQFGNDTVVGTEAGEVFVSRSDQGETVIAQSPETARYFADQPFLDADDILTGGGGADEFIFRFDINAREDIVRKHTMDNGRINWHGVAGENDNLHDHWVDGIGNDTVTDFSFADGDTFQFVGHTVAIGDVSQIDQDGDGLADYSLITIISDQGANGGAHNQDVLGTVTVYGDLLTAEDLTVTNINYGATETLDQWLSLYT